MVSVKLDLLSPGIEVGLVTTNLEAMVAFYEGFLELEPQGEIEFEGGSQRRYSLGGSVLKLVSYTPPPAAPAEEPAEDVVEESAEETTAEAADEPAEEAGDAAAE